LSSLTCTKRLPASILIQVTGEYHLLPAAIGGRWNA
jgi:hypothetical protein